MHTITATPIDTIPDWARGQRSLLDHQASVLETFVDAYFASDYEPFWPPEGHVGVDGYDDLLEGFYNWPLLYAMGGHASLLSHAQGAYAGAVEKCSTTPTPFGHPMVVDEFEQCRDWFHHGEANQFTYNMGLAAPDDPAVRERAQRFADLYLGDSPTENYDPERRLVRAPQTGSMGPDYCDLSAFGRQSTFGGYGASYRWMRHGLPWRDLEFERASELTDPENEDRLFEIFDERCARGDIPMNLAITSLMTNAYLHTGAEYYRDWVLEYLDAWEERTDANDGIIPDNVGLSGTIGEDLDGSWFGAMYGWSWGGWHYVGLGPLIAAENATLLTGDPERLAFPRSQLDILIEEGLSVPGRDRLLIPNKHGAPGDYHYDATGVVKESDGEVFWRDGWYEFGPHSDTPLVFHLWYLSHRAGDRDRVERLGPTIDGSTHILEPITPGKHGTGTEHAWLAYLEGRYPEYPVAILEAALAGVDHQEELMRVEGFDPEDLTEDYLRERNPIIHRPYLQLTMGAPQPVYYGGIVHAQVRHFDPDRERPGLPKDVAALVEEIDETGISLRLVNTGNADRTAIVQGGAYGEHTFQQVRVANDVVANDCETFTVELPGTSAVGISADMHRFDNKPSYAFPWM